MKKIENKKFSIVDSGQPVDVRFLLDICIREQPQQGFDLNTMRARFRVADALEAAKGKAEFELEDADYAVAAACVQAKRWPVMHRDIVEFCAVFGL